MRYYVALVGTALLCWVFSTTVKGAEKMYVPNAWESHGKTYHVAQNHPKASDKNPGTQELPFKTISAAAALVDAYDTVLIDQGIYRETVTIHKHGSLYNPRSLILFKAVPGKEVYLTGSDPFDADWKEVGNGTYKALLPASLFAKDAYNPYELSCVIDEPGKVRPMQEPELPETLGQIYVQREPLEQLTSVQAVTDTSNSFVVSADGKEVICHFADGKVPEKGTVELTVRERCIRPSWKVSSGDVFTAPMMQTKGMVVEHAAEPGPFCIGRPLTIRNNPGTGITVRKTFHALQRATEWVIIRGPFTYLSKDRPTLFFPLRNLSRPTNPDHAPVLPMLSNDSGKTWTQMADNSLIGYGMFLHEETGVLARWRAKEAQISRDGGKTWTDSRPADFRGPLLKLKDGRYLRVRTKWGKRTNYKGDYMYGEAAETSLGTWRDDNSGFDWEPGGTIESDESMNIEGLNEQSYCQLEDGRIFIIFRQAAVLAGQDSPGYPSVKLISVSDDCGRTWSKVRPLTYEDGKYVYSSCSMPYTFRSSKNGKVYVILNIHSAPTYSCDPRTTLNIAELNTETLSLKRNTIAIIETKQPGHNHHVRFSNFAAATIEDRYTKNLLLFMKLQMSENCPIRSGYDFNSYRYEIILPE